MKMIDSEELQRLAATAVPYLVLRAGHVLQRYISVTNLLSGHSL